MSVEVKIGIENSPRELTVSTKDSQDDVYKAVSGALDGSKAVLELTDEKGAKVIVPVTKIAYVEVGSAESRKVGFGSD